MIPMIAIVSRPSPPWWLAPWSIILAALLPITLFAHVAPLHPRMAPGLDYRTFPILLLALLFLAALTLGTRLAQRLPATRDVTPPEAIAGVALDVLASLALLAYVIWFGPLLMRPDLLATVFGLVDPYAIRNEWWTIPGVTTLSQLTVVFVALYAWRYLDGVRRPGRRRHTIWLLLLLAATLFRAVVWTERLAFFDLVVVAVAIAAWHAARHARFARLLTAGPARRSFTSPIGCTSSRSSGRSSCRITLSHRSPPVFCDASRRWSSPPSAAS